MTAYDAAVSAAPTHKEKASIRAMRYQVLESVKTNIRQMHEVIQDGIKHNQREMSAAVMPIYEAFREVFPHAESNPTNTLVGFYPRNSLERDGDSGDESNHEPPSSSMADTGATGFESTY